MTFPITIAHEKLLAKIFVQILLISYLCGINQETDTSQYVRKIFKTPQFEAFFSSLPSKVQVKMDYVMNVIATVYNVSTKFVKHLDNTDLYELRVSVGTNEYRTVLFAIDHENVIEAKNIILLNGFLKKDNKDYRKQIKIAEAILNNLEL